MLFCCSIENPSVSSDNATMLYAKPGATVQLVVYVFGIPDPRADEIVWYRNDTLITQSVPFTLSHDHLRLTINNIGTQYYGVYHCNVTTSNGTSSYFFTIMRPCKSTKCFTVHCCTGVFLCACITVLSLLD